MILVQFIEHFEVSIELKFNAHSFR